MKKFLILSFVVFCLFVGFVVLESTKTQSSKLLLVFCDVGQGDAIFIRTPGGSDILVDGGPDNKVLDCLSSYMPFWDRDIELVILTHPHADHLNGLIEVFKRYHVKKFATENLANTSAGYKKLMEEVASQDLMPLHLFAGDVFRTKDNVVLHIEGPSRSLLATTNTRGIIGETKEFGNVVTKISYGNFNALLTGDSQVIGLSEAIEYGNLKRLSIFQVPHHGSRFGTTKEILAALRPGLGIISVGAKNRYGHPAPQTLTNLQQVGIPYLMTKDKGNIVIESDGKSFRIKN